MSEDVVITAPRICVETITPTLALVIFRFLSFNHTRRRHNASFINYVREWHIAKLITKVTLLFDLTGVSI